MEHFPALQDLKATQSLIAHNTNHYQAFGCALYAVEIADTHEFIGFVGLNSPTFSIPHFIPHSLPIMEIGWPLAHKHWGKGYATEAASAILNYAFSELGLQEIISFTAKTNTRSERIMQKIGMQHFPEDDFNHPKLETTHPLCAHFLYRLTKDMYLGQLCSALQSMP